MYANPLHIQTFAPFQPCVEKEEGTQRVYKRCGRETLAFTADDENGVRCWIKGRAIPVRGIQGKPREGWSFETLNRVLNAYKITPSKSVDALGEISAIALSVRGLGGMQISIKIVENGTTTTIITIDVSPEDTIENIKTQIALQADIPQAQQTLIFAGMILKDQKTLEFYIKNVYKNVDSEKEYVLYLMNRSSKKPQKNLQYSLRIFLTLITCIFFAIVSSYSR